MIKGKISSLAVVVLNVFIAGTVFAGLTVKLEPYSDSLNGKNYYGFPTGSWAGATLFTAYGNPVIGEQVPSPFISFCVEANENIDWGHTYNAVINDVDSAVQGGYGVGDTGTSSSDPLSPQTKWLYSDYLNTSPFTTPVGSAGKDDANTKAYNYQLAIWHLENELLPSEYYSDGKLKNGVVEALVAQANEAVAAGLTPTNIRVLNLFDQSTSANQQDMLVLITTNAPPPPPVPAPGAILLGGLGMTLVGWLRNRKSM